MLEIDPSYWEPPDDPASDDRFFEAFADAVHEAAGGHVVTSPWRDGLPRDCIVCGHPTQDVTYSGNRKTPRCADFQPCADRRDAGRARPRTEAGRRLKALAASAEPGQEGGPS